MKLKTMKMKISAFLCALCVLCFEIAARAQLTSTYYTNCLAVTPLQCNHTTTNLQPSQYNTNNIWQGRHIGIGVNFVGGASTNTGTVGFQFAVRSRANGVVTTTRPFTITSTANGTTPVTDWAVIPNYNLGPADALVLVAITNATVNVSPSAGSITVSNVWLQMDTLSRP